MGLLFTAPEPARMPAAPLPAARPPLGPPYSIRHASQTDPQAVYVATLPDTPRPEKLPTAYRGFRAYRERSPGAFFEDVEIDQAW